MAQPSEVDIADFLECTYTNDRETAITFIRCNNNDATTAVNAYFDDSNPARYQTRYDESQWLGDRHGGDTLMENYPPFQTVEAEGVSPDLMSLTGPSRPPSRVNYQQGWDSYNNNEQGPKMSTGYQEMGIIASESKEYVPDADPAERIRQRGQPAFLKPLPQGDFLPSLITILQTIPACRDILLDVAHLDDYGHNGRWWEGEPIQALKTDPTTSDDTVNNGLLHEVQRLMAFLENTDRSYGSAEALAQLTMCGKPMDEWVPEPLFARFMSCLEEAVQTADEQHVNSMFRIRRIASSTGQWATRDSCFVAIDESDFGFSTEPDLYEVIDHHVWGPSWPIAEPQYWLDDNVAAICVIHLPKPSPKAPKRHLSVPSTLCADRYLRSKAEHIQNMREQTREYAAQMDHIQNNIRNIQTHCPVGGVELNASLLLGESIRFLEERQSGRANAATSKSDAHSLSSKSASKFNVIEESGSTHSDIKSDWIHLDISDESEPSLHIERDAKLLMQLKKIAASLETKASALYEEQTNARNKMKQLSQLFTDPSVEGPLAPGIKYSLRGVATKPSSYYNVTYAMFPKPSDGDIENDNQGLEWWKITYDGETSSASIEKERIKEDDVIQAVKENSCEALLVYAREELCEAEESEIPEALQRFVKLDNMSFAIDLTRRSSIAHNEFATFDEDIANDESQLPPPSYAPLSSRVSPGPRQMEEIRNDAEVIMGVSPSLAPTKSVNFADEDFKMGG